MIRNVVIPLLIVILCAALAVGQTVNPSRCLQFTWLGPNWTNESNFDNATCGAVTNLANGIPCFKPLVVSEDGTWPDIPYIWQNHEDVVTCTITGSDVCASYTYFFDGHAENATFMCTRAVDSNGVAISSGCYEQRNGSFASRVCFCQPTPGATGIPCNSAGSLFSYITLSFIIIVHQLIKKYI